MGSGRLPGPGSCRKGLSIPHRWEGAGEWQRKAAPHTKDTVFTQPGSRQWWTRMTYSGSGSGPTLALQNHAPTVPHLQDPSLTLRITFTICNRPLAKLLHAFPSVHSVSATVSGNLLIVPKYIVYACSTFDAHK